MIVTLLGSLIVGAIVVSFVMLVAYLLRRSLEPKLSMVRSSQPTSTSTSSVRLREDRRLPVGPFTLSVASGLGMMSVVVMYVWLSLTLEWSGTEILVGIVLTFLILLILDRLREFYAAAWLIQDSVVMIALELMNDLVHAVQELMGDSGLVLEPAGVVRCNVMEYDITKNTLGISLRVNMDDAPDRDLAIEPGKGVAGIAWARQAPVFGELSELRWRKADEPDQWGFTSEDWAKTRTDLQWAWSAPLWSASGGIRGVLNVDSNVPINKELAASIGSLVEHYASPLSIVMALMPDQTK